MCDQKKCPKCNVEKPRTVEYFHRNKSRPDGLHAVCKECEKADQKTDEYKTRKKALYQNRTPNRIAHQKEYAKKYQQTETYKSYQRNYERTEKRKAYKKNYEKTEQRKTYHKTRRHSEHGKRYMKQYATGYKQTEKYKAYQREYNRSDPAKEAHKKYHQTERGKLASLVQKHRRRAREMSANGGYTVGQWLELCTLYNYECLACREKKPLAVDHIVPLSKGGSNEITNIQPLCQSCNSEKGTQIIDYRPRHI